MKKIGKENLLLIILFIVFPLIYFVHSLVTPSPNEAGAVTAQSGLHSEVVDQHMDGGTLVVTMRNVGSNPWKETDWIRCTIFIDGKDSDVRAYLEPGQVVPVGESVEFRFPEIKPMLNETAEIVMLQENVAYFPEKVPVIFAQATTPATDASIEPQQDLHSEVVAQQMDGDTLVVTMRNVGSNPWKETDWIRCTIFLDGRDSDVRAYLEPGQVVPVGESVEFRFPDIKPMLNETAEIVMLQETIAYFPERVAVNFE